VSIQPRRIRHFKIALSRNTVELPWPSRTRLLERVGRHNGGLQVRLAFEAVGATRPVKLDPAGKRVLLQVVERWLAEPGYGGMPDGIRELRDELQNELADGDLDDN
jgi:hypothetical protein